MSDISYGNKFDFSLYELIYLQHMVADMLDGGDLCSLPNG
jgi:hypothetical protein